MQQWLIQISRDLMGLLFPSLCCGCGTHLNHTEFDICIKCKYQIPYTDYHNYQDNRVAKQFWGRIPFNAAMALLYFKKGGIVQQLIHQLKYKGQTSLGIQLGQMIGTRLLLSPLYQHIDLIIPVPIHDKKRRLRGYNQSEYIAKGIAIAMNLPVNSNTLLKVMATETQTKKGRYTRYENMKMVFALKNQTSLYGQHVLLVDDVITTGATIEACANLLHTAGIKKLSIAAAAFAD